MSDCIVSPVIYRHIVFGLSPLIGRLWVVDVNDGEHVGKLDEEAGRAGCQVLAGTGMLCGTLRSSVVGAAKFLQSK